MRINLIVKTAVLLVLTQTLRAQSADEYVSQGRMLLAQSNLAAANNSFFAAVSVAPNDQTANAFYAATRLLVLPSVPSGSNFLGRLGLPDAGRNIYNWTARLPADTNGVPLAPDGVNANEFTAMLRTNILPALIAAEANLAKVTDTNFTLTLAANEIPMVAITLDYGDILMLRAMLQAAQYFAYTTYSWNLDAQLAAIRALHTDDQLSIGRLLKDYPHLLTFATTNDLNAAKLAFQNGVARYLEASLFVRNRSTNVTRLFSYDGGMAHHEEKFRLTLIDLENSLRGPTPLTVNTNYTVFMASHFDGTHSMRSFLPDIHDNGFVLGSLPDLTFGGLFYGINNTDVEQTLAKYMDPIPGISPLFSSVGGQLTFPLHLLKGRGYVVQVSSNLVDWADYAPFVSWTNTYAFVDPGSSSLAHRFYRLKDSTANMPPPSNDNFANRILLTGLGITAFGYVANATVEPGEPNTWSGTAWWTWTAPTSGRVVVSTVGSQPFPYVLIYTGGSVETLAVIASGDTPFDAVAGTTYQIQVMGWGPSPAGVRLTIASPPDLTVSSPLDGAVLLGPTNILISASATDRDGVVARMEAFADSASLGSSSGGSLSLVWTNVPPGFHSIQVEATDNLGVNTSSYLNITVRPSNDDFANRTLLTGSTVITNGSNQAATKEIGEPDHAGYPGGVSIWWSWIAPSNAVVTISAGLNDQWGYYGMPLLGVYTGTSVTNLNAVASSAAYTWDTPAQVTFMATEGAAYQIAVDDVYGETGNITLKVMPTQPPVVTIVSPTDGAFVFGPTNITIMANASDPDGTISRVDFYRNANWIGSATSSPYSITWTNVTDGSYSLMAKATDNEGAFAYSTAVSLRVTPPNDDFANRILIVGTPATVSGSNVGASKEPGEPDHAGYTGGASVWWTWTAPFSGVVSISAGLHDDWGYHYGYPLLAVYIGPSVSALTTVASTASFSWGSPAQVSFTVVKGTAYQIAFDDLYGYTGNIVFNLTALPVVVMVSPTNGSMFIGPTNITLAADASAPDGNISRVDFYSDSTWIGSATSSPYSIIWTNVTGGSYSASARATDNEGAYANSSTVSFRVTPPNDDFANRISITGAATVATGSNAGANKEPGEPDHAGYAGGASVWWTWTAPFNGAVFISASLSNAWDGYYGYPLLAVYTGPSVSALSTVASTASFSWGSPAQVSFTAAQGTTYQIALDENFGYTGDIVLNLTETPIVVMLSPTNDSVFIGPTNITLTADASAFGDTVSRVDFYSGSSLIGFATNSPYSITWSNVPFGSYTVNARATHNTDSFTDSASINFWVSSAIPSGMALIGSGPFTMGNCMEPSEGYNTEIPLHSVYVSAFYMDKYDVTKALWDEVYDWATNHGYSFEYGAQGKAANHPAQSMTWYDAVKWCNARSEKAGRTPAYYTSTGLTTVYRSGEFDLQNDWVKWDRGYRLPTEAEWEKAARGGVSGQRFPWGNTISWGQANYYAYTSVYAYEVNPTSGYDPMFNDGVYPYTSPVGYFAPNRYGLYDMAGNVWQLCWDWHGSYLSSSQSDPRGPASGSIRVTRGGGWNSDAYNCRVAIRYNYFNWYYHDRGFRSVLAPGQ